jgi:hypothetical protein
MKYDGYNNNFKNKQTIFENVCKRADLPLEQYMRAFPIMFKGLVQDYYYNNQLSKYLYHDACEKIRTFFEPLEY